MYLVYFVYFFPILMFWICLDSHEDSRTDENHKFEFEISKKEFADVFLTFHVQNGNNFLEEKSKNLNNKFNT